MRRPIASAGIIAAALAAAAPTYGQDAQPQQMIGTAIMCTQDGCVESPNVDTCREDMPCWAWSRMGNRKRGVLLADGRRVIVGPCGFKRLHDRGKVHGQKIRGDAWAVQHGCAR